MSDPKTETPPVVPPSRPTPCSASRLTFIAACMIAGLSMIMGAIGQVGDETVVAAIYWPMMTSGAVWILEQGQKKPNNEVEHRPTGQERKP